MLRELVLYTKFYYFFLRAIALPGDMIIDVINTGAEDCFDRVVILSFTDSITLASNLKFYKLYSLIKIGH